MHDWNPDLYRRYEDERTRPAQDLLARVPLERAARVVDLGCGPGNSTELLVRRFATAQVTGTDNSEAMLASARQRLPQLRFELSDIARWTPDAAQGGAPDLIYANAALQWVPDHETLIPRLFAALAPGGVLAVQMPDNRQEPSHALMRLIAADGPWADRLVPIAKTRAVIQTHTDYYNWLRPASDRLEIWQTTFVHPLKGVDAVVDWFRGSALLPFLAPLAEPERRAFLARYRDELADAYSVEPDGQVLFLYPRLFVLAHKAADAR